MGGGGGPYQLTAPTSADNPFELTGNNVITLKAGRTLASEQKIYVVTIQAESGTGTMLDFPVEVSLELYADLGLSYNRGAGVQTDRLSDPSNPFSSSCTSGQRLDDFELSGTGGAPSSSPYQFSILGDQADTFELVGAEVHVRSGVTPPSGNITIMVEVMRAGGRFEVPMYINCP